MRPSSTYFPIKTLFLAFATIFTLLSACVPMEEEGMEVLEGKKREPVLSISPNSGPSGTSARITLTQAIPFAEVVLDLGAETKYGESNEDGEWITTYTFTGAAGDQLNVQARIGAPVEESASATFRITGEGEEGAQEDSVEAVAFQVRVDPAQGSSRTTTSITILGAPAREAVTLMIQGTTFTPQVNTQGTATHTQTFTGEEGQEFSIEVTVGSGDTAQTVSTTFKITGPFEQTYYISTLVAVDDGGLAEAVGLDQVDEISAREGSLIIDGKDPWVDVIGEFFEERFFAEGSGSVAGYENIYVSFNGTISMEEISGVYLVGERGGLPGGNSVMYLINGTGTHLSGVAAPQSDFDEVYQFYSWLNGAQHFLDAEGMLDMLHPAVIERYGHDTCLTHISATINPDILIKPHTVVGEANWIWSSDNRSTTIEEAFAVDVISLIGSTQNPEKHHLGRRPDGTLGWFTDCGDPQ